MRARLGEEEDHEGAGGLALGGHSAAGPGRLRRAWQLAKIGWAGASAFVMGASGLFLLP
jgi:hypothetical protein